MSLGCVQRCSEQVVLFQSLGVFLGILGGSHWGAQCRPQRSNSGGPQFQKVESSQGFSRCPCQGPTNQFFFSEKPSGANDHVLLYFELVYGRYSVWGFMSSLQGKEEFSILGRFSVRGAGLAFALRIRADAHAALASAELQLRYMVEIPTERLS